MTALTLGQAKSHLNIASDDTARDLELQGVVDAAEGAVVARVGPLVPLPVVSRVTTDGAGRFWLPRQPVVSLTAATAGRTAVDVGTLTLSPEDDGSVTGATPATVLEVTYLVGVPPDLLHAVKELVAHLWEPQRGAGRGAGPRRDRADDAPSAPGYFMPNRVAEMLEPHRWRRGFGIA